MNELNAHYEEPQVHDLGSALTFFLGDSGDAEDSAKVLPCTQCSLDQTLT
jgi:hypothetical protein